MEGPGADIKSPGIGLTHITKSAYNGLLKDATLTPAQFEERYGAGWVFRLQGALCAYATRSVHQVMIENGDGTRSADELYKWVMTFQGDIFEFNGLEEIKPGKATFEMMVYSMCQAETGDYGEEW